MARILGNCAQREPGPGEDWAAHAGAYVHHVQDESKDSHFLRETGLKAMLLRLAGDCQGLRALDVGCGTGWLLEALRPEFGHGCDVRRYEQFSGQWHLCVADTRRLCYADAAFDVTISSLVLMWFDELDLAVQELARVTRPGGKVIIGLVHPYFYRTGETNEDGSFTVCESLAHPFSIEEHMIAGSVGPFRYRYRPITEYLNSCVRAGLQIREVADWYIDMPAFRRRFGTDKPGSIRRTDKVPMYSFVACTRP